MSALWSEIALAHAARAKVEDDLAGGKAKLSETAGRRLRAARCGLLHSRLSSFALYARPEARAAAAARLRVGVGDLERGAAEILDEIDGGP